MIKLVFCYLSTFSFFPLAFQDVGSNILIYNDPVQVSTEVNEFEEIQSGKPFIVSIMVTHDSKNIIDLHTFKLGETSINPEFVKTVQMSISSPIIISIYQFSSKGMQVGSHTLPPVKVKVGGKEYQSLPLTIDINS